MSDKKISQLNYVATPLIGTEELPIVQNSVTKKVNISDITAGRSIAASSLSLTSSPLSISSGGTGLISISAGYIPFGSTSESMATTENLVWSSATNTLIISKIGVNTAQQIGYYAAINGDTWFGNTGGVQIGKISNSSGWFDFSGASAVNGAQISSASSTPVRILSGGNENTRFQTNGDVLVSSGNVILNASGKGITLKSPNGLITKTLTIDNAGLIALI